MSENGIDGAVVFARFAFPPNELGYCGPEDHGALLEYADAAVSDGGLRRLAARFDGAWPYLELIAHSNRIEDPLDRRVVEAYWIGSPLLDSVDRRTFADSLEARFRARAGSAWSALHTTVPAGGIPHHSFHVFAVYPWVGLLRAGHVDQPLRVLDRCRIRCGIVVAVLGEEAVVSYRPLEWDGYRLGVGSRTTETVRLGDRGYALAREVVPGDLVALHWDWVCDRLDEIQVRRLRRYSQRMLDLVNSLSRPAPAAVLG